MGNRRSNPRPSDKDLVRELRAVTQESWPPFLESLLERAETVQRPRLALRREIERVTELLNGLDRPMYAD